MSADPRGLPADDPRLRTYESVYPGFEIGLYLPEDNAAWLDHLARRHGRRPSLKALFGGPLGAPAPYAAEDSETAFLADAFLTWLERREEATPWCAHLSFLKPHPPLVAPDPWHALYRPDEVPPPVRAATPEAEASAHPWLAAKLARPLSESWYGKPAGLDDATIRQARAVYYGLIGEVDHHIGRILAALEAQGERAETLIVFTSDHGEMLGDHWLLGKDGFFPQAFHVPLIIVDPRAESSRGRVVEAFSEHVDLLPTLLERLGREVPLHCDGVSLCPWLAGKSPAGWRGAAHFEHDFRDVETLDYERALGLASTRCALAVRQSEDYAYVHFNGLPPLCYDLAADPQQFHSIAADPRRAPEVLEQAQAMLTWRMNMAERRLTGCKLTPAGIVGRF